MGVHLLASVYVTPQGLKGNKYKLGRAFEPNDQFFRISRFLTSLGSLRQQNWSSLSIYFVLDPVWIGQESAVQTQVKLLFPDASVYAGRRLLSREEWALAAANYAHDDIIWLHANDDHALVVQDPSVLTEMVQTMQQNRCFPLGAITHQPEMQGLVSRMDSKVSLVSANLNWVPTTFGLGTMLIRGDQFASWWSPSSFDELEQIARPDNPLGKSVSFPTCKMLVPRVEIMRHMDGYKHVGLQRPLAPLRNTIRFQPKESKQGLEMKEEWRVGYWPARIRGYSRRGSADLHRITDGEDGFLSGTRSRVATLQSAWSFRIHLRRSRSLLDPKGEVATISILMACAIALMTPPVIRNFPDSVCDSLWNLIPRSKRTGHDFFKTRYPPGVAYHGWMRTIFFLIPRVLKGKIHERALTQSDKQEGK